MNFFQQHAPAEPDKALAQIRIIDLERYLRDDDGALASVAEQVRRACETVGFFYIDGHGVPESVIDQAFEQNRRFHSLPEERKRAVSINENNVGYLGMNASIQRHSSVHEAIRPNQNESFFENHDRGADHPHVRNRTPIGGQNLWPEGLPGFREAVMRYFHTLRALAQRMLPTFAVAMGMPEDYLVQE